MSTAKTRAQCKTTEKNPREEMQRYNIVRMYFNTEKNRKIIHTGLTLAEAKAHCENPETSSRTCTTAIAKQRTARNGEWFDGFEKG